MLVWGWRVTDSRLMVEEWVGANSGAADRNTVQVISLDSSIVQPGEVIYVRQTDIDIKGYKTRPGYTEELEMLD